MTAWVLPTRAATSRFGEALGKRLQAGDTVALIGDLGAGKTTLAQAIARGCGITSQVSSPTFGLIHEYPGRIPLFHFDPYRLQRAEDLNDLGFHEFFERGGVVLVEWADMVDQLLPPDRITLRLEIDMDTEPIELSEEGPRMLDAQAGGERYLALLAQLAEAPELRDLLASDPESRVDKRPGR
jgi:tRNA threonylcarbamoyladenosine biosynthesis protein TsaE